MDKLRNYVDLIDMLMKDVRNMHSNDTIIPQYRIEKTGDYSWVIYYSLPIPFITLTCSVACNEGDQVTFPEGTCQKCGHKGEWVNLGLRCPNGHGVFG